MKNAEKRGGGEILLALDELADCVPSDNSVEREIEAAELAKDLNAFIQMLSTSERDIFIGRYWFILPIVEISAKTGFGESKTKMMLFRTRKKLRVYLKRKGY